MKAEKLLNEAQELFDAKREKDAYEKASYAVRFYFSRFYNTCKEMNSTELNNMLRKHKHKDSEKVKGTLSLCGMVEFAKYNANKKDFEKIMKNARNKINGK